MTAIGDTAIGDWLAANADLARVDRETLLCHATGLTRAQVLARPELPLAEAAACRLAHWAARRRDGEPIAYILGRKEFWGLELAVSPAVLVPRPDTELLVEVAIELLGPSCRTGLPAANACRSGLPAANASACRSGLGTGSGAVAIALARECPAARITATDLSAQALAVARANGDRHGVEITWVQSDWYTGLDGRFDVIVSNPPYVADGDPHLAELGHEPRSALVAGRDGLDAIRRICAGAPGYLDAGGCLALEHGWNQGAAVRTLLTGAGFETVTTHRDLAGRERVTRGRLRGEWT